MGFGKIISNLLEAYGTRKGVDSTYGKILSLGYFVNVFKLIEIDG